MPLDGRTARYMALQVSTHPVARLRKLNWFSAGAISSSSHSMVLTRWEFFTCTGISSNRCWKLREELLILYIKEGWKLYEHAEIGAPAMELCAENLLITFFHYICILSHE